VNKMPERPPSRPPVAEPFGAPRIAEQTTDHAFGTWHHLVIVVWKRETTVRALMSIGALVRALAKERGTQVGLLSIVEDGAPLPSAEARKVTAEQLHGAPINLSAMAFEGQGFRAAAVRGAITGIGLLARTPYPHRTFGTVKDAAVWIEKETHGDQTRAMMRSGIVGAVSKFRL
jgi:hypothetical protein